MDLDKYYEVTHSKDRIYTGTRDIDGMKINVGDAIQPIGSNEIYCINYNPEKKVFYGLGHGNKIMKKKDFSKCKNVGIAIFNDDMREICSK